MFATSAREVVPRTKQNISAKKTMGTTFCTSTRLLVLNFPQKAPSSIKIILLIQCFPISTGKRDELRGARVCRVFQSTWTIQCVITAQISLKNMRRDVARALHPLYSPDHSPRDLWLFGILKQEMKERVFESEEQILAAITKSWNKPTFEDIQRVSHNWMERLIWVIADSGEYYQS
jgi:hypothetical protein